MKFSVVILALFVVGSDAFAPSPSASMASRTRLQAGSDLTSLLGEYSGSASAPAATKAVEAVVATPVEKAVEAVVSAPVVDNMAAINDAAAAAQSAADQAAAAAAAVAASSVPAIKAAASGAAATAAASGSSIKPLIGGVFVKVDSTKINPDMQFDASARAQENLATLKANFAAAMGGLSEKFSSINIPKPEGGVEGGNVDFSGVDLSSFSAADLQTIVDSLHLKEYGGWYAAAAMTIIASQQKASGKEEAAAEFESELTLAQQKASEAASAAGMAAEGAKMAKELAMKMDKDSKKDSGQAMLESSKMKQILLEKETMEQKIRELQAEVSKLNSQLEQATEGKKKAIQTVSSKKTEIEEEYPNKVTLEGDPDEDARIIEILKMMDEENKGKKAAAAAEAEKKREEEASYVKSQKNVDKKMTKGVEVAQAKAEVATKKKRATKKKSATKSKAKTSAKKKATPAPAKAASGGNDWAQLAESTLKRKTVAQLTEYLTEKGVSVEKSMKKADLLNAVKSL